MALPTASETKAFDTYITTYLGEPFMIGPAKTRQVGGQVTGGSTEDVIEVTNTNDTGAGSFRQAIADCATAGGGWVRVTVSGTVSLASDINIDNPVNITVDARGQDFTLSGRGIFWNDTAGGTSNNGNIIWINVQQRGGANNNDHMQNYNRDHDFAGGFFLAYSEVDGFDENNTDEVWDFHINCPDNVGKDIETAFLRFTKGETDTNGLCLITWADGGSPANNPSKFKMLEHHTYYAPTSGGRAIDFRTPLHGGRSTSGGSLATAAVHYLANCFIAAQENGAYCSGSAWMHAVGCTLDGQYAGADKTILLRDETGYGSPCVRVDDVRLLNSASYHEANTSTLTTAQSLWTSFTYCTPSAAHDTLLQKRAGASLRVLISGTAVGTAGSALSGTYFDLTWPTGTLPTSTTFDDMRQAVIDGWASVGGQITGADMFTGVGQITRQSATVIRCTVNANVTIGADEEVYWWGPFSSVSDTRHYGTPFPASVTGSGAPVASGDTLVIFRPFDNEPPSSAYATIDLRNGHPVLDFDGSTDEEAVFTGVLPRRYAGGGLTVTTYWAATAATSGSFRVQAAIERIDASSLDIDADSFTAFQSAGGSAPATNGQVVAVAVTFTDGAQMDSLAVGETFRLKIRRDADGTSGSDTITTDLELLSCEIRET